MRAAGGEFTPNAEVDELRWLPPDKAALLLTHDHDRAVLADLTRDDVPRAPSLLLVRHADAGDRSDWDGPDELRPLSTAGRRQARRLAEVLPLFGPGAVLSAEPVRCRETVEPLAAAVGVAVGNLPELGEERFQEDPRTALTVVEELLAAPPDAGPVVVCSQGGAIPSLLLALGVATEGRPWPPSAKGSVWAIGGRAGALLADYYRNFAPDPDAPTV
jgi:8-oxo-(d)GTP phosphatase